MKKAVLYALAAIAAFTFLSGCQQPWYAGDWTRPYQQTAPDPVPTTSEVICEAGQLYLITLHNPEPSYDVTQPVLINVVITPKAHPAFDGNEVARATYSVNFATSNTFMSVVPFAEAMIMSTTADATITCVGGSQS